MSAREVIPFRKRAREMPISEASKRWIDAAKQVGEGEREGILCPQNGDDFLAVEWIPFENSTGGEWWLHCPACGAQNFPLVRHDPNAS
jgi:hypothetical protein